MGAIAWADKHDTNAEDVFEALRQAEKAYDTYMRVHLELDEGKPWGEIDHGLKRALTYDDWYAYITHRIVLDMRNVIGIFRDAEGRPISSHPTRPSTPTLNEDKV